MAADSPLPPDGPLHSASMIDGLAGSIREAWGAFPQDHESRTRQISPLVGDILVSLRPLVSALELRPGDAAELLKRRMNYLDQTASMLAAMKRDQSELAIFFAFCFQFAADIREKWQAVARNDEAAEIPEPLSERQEEAAVFIRQKGFASAKEIANHLGIQEPTVRSRLIPALKIHGLRNKKGRGYYFPGDGKTAT